jgi:glycosyltransferase involved in cell wall biosynthesis
LKNKLAFIVQRYGLDVNGGAEYHCRLVAERLSDIYDVTVLTSCATNYLTWKNEYPEGTESINNVTVHRFAAESERDKKRLRASVKKLKKRKLHQVLLKKIGLLGLYEKIVPYKVTIDDFNQWSQYQGPYVPELINYLEQNQQDYDALIFFTYLYYPTVRGINVAPGKSILIPTAHDEPPIYFPFFKEFFNTPKAILYNTASEQRFVNKLFCNEAIYSDIVGVGIDAVEPSAHQKPEDILGTDSEYLIYIGRIDPSKGCKVMFDHFLDYKKSANNNIKLLLIGQPFMQVPVNKDIISLGFVDENIKIDLLKNARALIMPSFYESLSLVTLESMAYGVPVIANEQCEVLNDHIVNSKAGYLYNNYNSFKTAIDTLLNPTTDLHQLSINAKQYVAANYTWAVTIEKYRKAVDYVSPG